MDVIDQVMSIYAGTRGYLDQVPRNEVLAWEKAFLTFIKDQKPEVRKIFSDEMAKHGMQPRMDQAYQQELADLPPKQDAAA